MTEKPPAGLGNALGNLFAAWHGNTRACARTKVRSAPLKIL